MSNMWNHILVAFVAVLLIATHTCVGEEATYPFLESPSGASGCVPTDSCAECIETTGCGFCGNNTAGLGAGICLSGNSTQPFNYTESCSTWTFEGTGSCSVSCASYNTCATCTNAQGKCGWCPGTWTCMAASSSGNSSADGTCNFVNGTWTMNTTNCCDDYTDCPTCNDLSTCGWCSYGNCTFVANNGSFANWNQCDSDHWYPNQCAERSTGGWLFALIAAAITALIVGGIFFVSIVLVIVIHRRFSNAGTSGYMELNRDG